MIEGNNASCIAIHTGDESLRDFLQRARRNSAAAPDLTGLRDVDRLFRTGH
jgi:hypothetical protein